MNVKTFSEYSDPEEAILNEDLSKLGDSLVNLVYSLARSLARRKPDGDKVPNKVLSNSLSDAGMRSLAPSRMNKHQLGDIVEAIIAFAWLEGKMDIPEAAKVLSSPLSEISFQSRKEIMGAAEEGFKDLLIVIDKRIDFEGNKISENKT